jgi:PAS domain S-box-containing protein
MDSHFREKLFKILIMAGIFASLVNLPIVSTISTTFTLIVFGFAFLYFVILILLQQHKISYEKASFIALMLLFVHLLSIPIFGAVETLFLPWLLIYPIIVFSLKPSDYGLRNSLFLLFVFIIMYLLSYLHVTYTTLQIFSFGTLYTTVTIVFYFITKNAEENEKTLYNKNRELQNQKELYDLVFENSSNGVLIIDIDSGTFTHCNYRIVEILNYHSKEDVLQMHPSQLSPEYQPDGQRSDVKADIMMQKALKEGSITFEWEHKRATTELFWAEITLTRIEVEGKRMLHVVWKDIDSRKRSREALENMNLILEERVKEATQSLKLKNKVLQESINNFQNVLDTTMEMIVLIDENRRVVDINLSGMKMIGYSEKSELLNTHISNYILESDLPKIQKSMALEVADPYELTLIKKDGTLIPVLASAKNIISNGKKVRMSTILDLTEIKYQEKLLQQQARLAQMGEMMSMIAHQWRQPLGAISSAILSINTKQESGKFNLDVKEEREAMVHFLDKKHKNIMEYVQVLSSTIDDFRNFFKQDKAKELASLTIPIKRALNIVNNSMRSKNIALKSLFKCQEKLMIYPNEMMQVILNILKNAEDNFVERKSSHAKIFISTFKENDLFVIEITDNGGGIDAKTLPHIFEPYFSTKDEKNGTGLGLYMSKIIIEEHMKGSLSVKNISDDNGHNSGVSFRITLKDTKDV